MKRFGSDSFSIKSARLIANGTKASGHAMPKQINNLSDIPNMAGNSGFHRRGNTQGFMNPAEVIVHEVKRGCAWRGGIISLCILISFVLPRPGFGLGWNYKDAYIWRGISRENSVKGGTMSLAKNVIVQDESIKSQPFGVIRYPLYLYLSNTNAPSLLQTFAWSYAPTSVHFVLGDGIWHPRNRHMHIGWVKIKNSALLDMTRGFPSVNNAKSNISITKFVRYVELDGDPRSFGNFQSVVATLQLLSHNSESAPCGNCGSGGQNGQGPLRPGAWPEGSIPIEPIARICIFTILFFVSSRMAFLWGYDVRRYGSWTRIGITRISMLFGFAFLLVPGFALLLWKLCLLIFA